MGHHLPFARLSALSIATASLFAIGPLAAIASHAHEGHDSFSAGEPGNPKKPARVVAIAMQDAQGKMVFVPDHLEVKRGEQVRFIINNEGGLVHEFVLASTKDNLKHAALMQKYPDMEHDDPNGKTLQPKAHAEILWRFSKTGEFEFSCLIPGHRESGMLGKIVVK